jgi:hypothetical protein
VGKMQSLFILNVLVNDVQKKYLPLWVKKLKGDVKIHYIRFKKYHVLFRRYTAYAYMKLTHILSNEPSNMF